MEEPGRRFMGRISNPEGRPAAKKQEPVSLMGPAGASRPPKRQRQKRTVYSKEQLEVLEEHFRKDQYPSYRVREDLAGRLNLQEYKLQVWFKNRRAKCSRLKQLSQRQGQGPRGASTGHGASDDAAAGPAFPEAPGFCSPSGPSPAGMLPAPEPSVPSRGPAGWAPAQGLQEVFPAALAPAPAPAPVWPQDPYTSNFWPDPVAVFDFEDLFPLQYPSQGPPSPLLSKYYKGDDSAGENDSAPSGFFKGRLS